MIGEFKMVVRDVISIGGVVTKYTYIAAGINGSWWDLEWIATRMGKLSGLLEEYWWPFIKKNKTNYMEKESII